jgi:hypothetical protein
MSKKTYTDIRRVIDGVLWQGIRQYSKKDQARVYAMSFKKWTGYKARVIKTRDTFVVISPHYHHKLTDDAIFMISHSMAVCGHKAEML